MDKLSVFLAVPSAGTLKVLTKHQLVKLAEHYDLELDIPKGTKKDKLIQLVMERLAGREVFSFDPVPEPVIPAASSTPQGSDAASNRPIGLRFEQQMKLLKMQLERDQLLATECDKEREENRLEREKRREEDTIQWEREKLE